MDESVDSTVKLHFSAVKLLNFIIIYCIKLFFLDLMFIKSVIQTTIKKNQIDANHQILV